MGELASAKKAADAKAVKGVTAAKAEGTVAEEAEEVKIDLPVPEGKVKMKNITKANVFCSTHKIKPGDESLVPESDVELLKSKELCIEVD